MSPAGKKLLMATVVWGDWYVTALIDHTLPSLLSPNNLPLLAGDCDLEYVVMTRQAEAARIEGSPAVQLARRVMRVHVVPALPAVIDPSINVFNFHHLMWNFAHERAKKEGAYVFNVPPDAVFADGAGKTWADLLRQGMKSILWMFPRAVDTVMPVVRERYLTPDGAINVPPRDLVKLNLEYLHPLSKAYFADSPHFPDFHPEMMIWPVANEGLLMRGFAGEARLFDPRQVALTPQQIVTGPLDECTFIDDSDRMYMMSLAPAGHNADWYRPRAKADPCHIGRWWLNFDGTSNDLAASRQIRIHTGEAADPVWRARERRANLFISRAVASREFFRVANMAFSADCAWTAALLTMVGRTKACLRIFPKPMQTIVFGPTDAAVAPLSIGDFLKPNAARRLAMFLRSHVVIDERPGVSLADRVVQAGGVLRLRSLAGRDLIVVPRPDGRLMLGRFGLGTCQMQSRGHTFVPIEGVLDADAVRSVT
jgi:hypothetical protein